MGRKHILAVARTFGVGLAITAVLALPESDFSDWGTLGLDWDTHTFGWPFAVWSRTVHSTWSEGNRWVVQDTHYSIYWVHAAILYIGSTLIVAAAMFGIQKLRRNERG